MAKLENKAKDNPRLEQRVMADGRISLYLEYYLGRESEPVLDEYDNPILYESGAMKGKPKMRVKHLRRQENLNLYLIAKPRTPIERNQNAETLEVARKVCFERQQDFQQNRDGYRLRKDRQDDFLAFYDAYIDRYTKLDKRNIKAALKRFKDFLRDTPEYNKYLDKIKPEQITNDMIMDFADYLKSRSKGSGAATFFERFKKVFKAYAIKYNLNHLKPFTDHNGKSICIITDEGAITKDVLSPEEERQLIATHYPRQSQTIRNAFIFCLYTGVRWCDVKELKYSDFDLANRSFTFTQKKVNGHSRKSSVTLPLTDDLIELIGAVPEGGKDSLVFPLPSHNMCLKALRVWTKKAGIDKHITWHCARHSFGTNMAAAAASEGLPITVVQTLMGHSTIQYTQRYTRVSDNQKKAAMEKLSKLMSDNKDNQ